MVVFIMPKKLKGEPTMELKELIEKTLSLFNSKNTTELINKLPRYWNNNDIKAKFKALVGDLSIDWLQKIFQYYWWTKYES